MSAANKMHLNIFKKISAVGLGVAAVFLCACGVSPRLEKARNGQALYEERCKTVAGEKIYKKVENVEGILLLKIRPESRETNRQDRNYPGAAFADEAGGDDYITTFLSNEFIIKNDTPNLVRPPGYRGHINPAHIDSQFGGKNGYKYVDVIDATNGVRYRYTAEWKDLSKDDPQRYLKGHMWYFLKKDVTTQPLPRYAVTYEDHVIPEERVLGVASTTIKVIDTMTNEVLGEFTRYAVAGGFEHLNSVNARPWLNAYKCGRAWGGGSSDAATRLFVDQILIPKQGG